MRKINLKKDDFPIKICYIKNEEVKNYILLCTKNDKVQLIKDIASQYETSQLPEKR